MRDIAAGPRGSSSSGGSGGSSGGSGGSSSGPMGGNSSHCSLELDALAAISESALGY